MTTSVPAPEIDEFIRLHDKENWTWNDIARHYGISYEQVRGKVRRRMRSRRPPAAQAQAPASAPPPDCDEWGVDDWLSYFRTAQQAHDQVDPVSTRHTVTIKADRSIAIQWVSCMHLGSRWVLYDAFRERHKRLCGTDGFYWVDVGDPIDNFPVTFRSAQAVYSQLANPQMQRAFLRTLIGQSPRKWLAACAGNHDGFDESRLGENLVKAIFAENKVPYFDGKGELTLRVGPAGHEQEYIIYMGHKFAGNSMWNPNHAQLRALFMEYPSADVIVSGHTHTAAVAKIPHHTADFDAGRRASEWAWLVQAGTAKAGNDQYSVKYWQHGVFEWPVLVFSADEHLIRLCDDPRDLRYFLHG